MSQSSKPPQTLRSRDVASTAAAPQGQKAPKPGGAAPREAETGHHSIPDAFVKDPKWNCILEESIFFDRFNEEYAGKTHMVGIDEVAAVKSSSPLVCIGTSTLSTCIGIAAYDPGNCVGSVAHVNLVSETQDFEHVARMISRVIEVAGILGGKHFLLYSFNGRNGSREWNDSLASFLEAQAGSLISSGIVSRFEQREEHNFVLDTRDGSIFTAKVGSD
jgi:hypothetical protein